jgi:surface polysaccharide O-acyltransferase-like enzyme
MISGTAHTWYMVVGASVVLLSPMVILIAIMLWETVSGSDQTKNFTRAVIFYLPLASTLIAGALLLTERPSQPDHGYELMTHLFMAVVAIDWIMGLFGKAHIRSKTQV